jgi:hypothetical protein
MIPMSPWGQDHLFDSASVLSRLAYGLWGFQEPSCSAAFSPAIARRRADNHCSRSWPFLLIVRTGRIVTASREASTAGYTGVPANSQLHSMRHRIEGQRPGTSGHSTLGPL